MSVSHADTVDTDVNLVVNANRSFEFESATESTTIEVKNAVAQQMNIIQFDDASVDFSVVMESQDSLTVGSTGEVVAEDAIFDSGSIAVQSNISASNGGEIQLKSDGEISIAADLTAASSITISDASLISIDSTAARIIQATTGDILSQTATAIQLDGGASTVSFIAGNNIQLADITSVNSPANGTSLAVQAGANVDLKSVHLAGAVESGSLTVSFDTDDSGTDTLSVGGIISDVSTLQFAGGADGNEVIDINADITANSIQIQNAANVTIDASTNRSLASLAGNVSISTNVGGIQFDNGTSDVAISSMGGDVLLSDIDTLGSDLTIDSKSNVTLADVELNGTAGISIDFDSDNDEAGILQLNGNIQNATSVTFDAGGTGTDDRINVGGNVDADAGNVDFGDASLVSIDATVARSINADVGNVVLDNVGAIELATGSATVTVSAGQDIELAAVSATFSDAANLLVQAGDDVTLQGIDLGGANSNGLLNVAFDTDGGGANVLRSNGNIRNVTDLVFTSGTAASNIIDINENITAESIDIQSVDQVLIDASADRDLIATAGNVAINQFIGGIEINGGSNLVSIQSTSQVLLAPVTTTSDAALAIQFDSDSDETFTFALNGSISGVSALTVAGGGVANGDEIVITSNLNTTAGNIDLQNVELVNIDSSVGRTLQADGGSVLIDAVGSIELTNGTATVELIADQNVQLAALSDNDGGDPGANLGIQAGRNVNLNSVSLAGTVNNGSLTVSFDTDNTGTDTLTVDGTISDVSALQFAGGADGDEVIDINGDITANSIQIQNAANVAIDASTARSLASLAGNVSIATNVGGIQFDDGGFEVSISSMGGDVLLSDIDTLGSDLTIDSKSNVTLADVELNGTAGISIDFDSDNDEAGILQLNGNIQNATSVTFDAGGTGTDDRINVGGNVDADAGNVDFGDASLVSIDATVGRSINADVGNVVLDNVGAIELAAGSATVTVSAGQDVSLGDVSDVSVADDAASLTIHAGGSANLDGVALDGAVNNGSLTVSFDTDNTGTDTLRVDGIISDVSALQFAGGADGDEVIDINGDITANSIQIQNAANVAIDASAARSLASLAGNVFNRYQCGRNSI